MANPMKRSRQERALMRRVEELDRWVEGDWPHWFASDNPNAHEQAEAKIEAAKVEIENLCKKLGVGQTL